MVAKDTKLLKIVIEPPPVFPLPAAAVAGEDPTLSDVPDLDVFVHNGSGGALGNGLTAGTWDALGFDPMNPRSYKYLTAMRRAAVRSRSCSSSRPSSRSLPRTTARCCRVRSAPPTSGRVSSSPPPRIVPEENGSEKVNTATKWRYWDNAAPAACPAPGGTTSTTTATPSTTSTTAGGPCCNGAGFYSFASILAPEDCGDIETLTGTRLSFHSDGRLRRPFLSGLVGELDCSTGLANLSIPVGMEVFMSGDLSPHPGIQPCPRCIFSTCDSGPSNGMACQPATTDLSGNPAYPTSHDCPPNSMLSVGTLPIGFTFTTGSISWTGTEATNDTQVEVDQPRLFSGYCRDADGPALFQAPAEDCWENGMAVGPPCAGVYETCEQRSTGAFGPLAGARARSRPSVRRRACSEARPSRRW